jgi:hypothetical protein
MGFFIWLFYIRLCAHLGSKRVIGTFDGMMLGAFFSILGIFIILSSRRLNDQDADAALAEKYKSI